MLEPIYQPVTRVCYNTTMQIDEVYDVVNEHGVKINTATWTEVHTRGLLHQVSHGILFKDDSRSKTLIKKRISTNLQEPGKYEISIAGHIITGDTPNNTIRKETQEELFADKPLPPSIIIQKLGTYINQDISNNKEIAHLYEIIHPGPFTLEEDETEEITWIDWEDLLKDMENNSDKYAKYSITAINTYLKLTNK